MSKQTVAASTVDFAADALSDLLKAARDVRVYVDKARHLDISGLAEKRLKALDQAIGKCEGRAP